MKTKLQILEEARELISDPKRWTQATFACTSDGEAGADWAGPEAVCWCADGALMKVAQYANLSTKDKAYWSAYQTLEECCDGSIHEYNDNHTHAEVLAVFDKAIAKVKSYAKT